MAVPSAVLLVDWLVVMMAVQLVDQLAVLWVVQSADRLVDQLADPLVVLSAVQ